MTLSGRTLTGDVVIDASGRASRFTGDVRPPAEGGDCGAVYVDRLYRFHDGAPAAPVNSPIGLSLNFPGYFAIAFLHDDRTFSITFAHDGTDRRLRRLRHGEVFESAVSAIPRLAEWTDPRHAKPIAPVLPGGKLYNSYRGQVDSAGRLVAPGMISVGDAVCTTTPLAGRGVTLALAQARALIGAFDEHGRDTDSATMQFDHWCTENIRPWFDDHRLTDADRLRRWSGGDVDTTRRLPSDLIVAAAAVGRHLARRCRALRADGRATREPGRGRAKGQGDLRRGLATRRTRRPDTRPTGRPLRGTSGRGRLIVVVGGLRRRRLRLSMRSGWW